MKLNNVPKHHQHLPNVLWGHNGRARCIGGGGGDGVGGPLPHTLVYLETTAFDDPNVRWQTVSKLHIYNVSHYEPLHASLLGLSIPHHVRPLSMETQTSQFNQ